MLPRFAVAGFALLLGCVAPEGDGDVSAAGGIADAASGKDGLASDAPGVASSDASDDTESSDGVDPREGKTGISDIGSDDSAANPDGDAAGQGETDISDTPPGDPCSALPITSTTLGSLEAGEGAVDGPLLLLGRPAPWPGVVEKVRAVFASSPGDTAFELRVYARDGDVFQLQQIVPLAAPQPDGDATGMALEAPLSLAVGRYLGLYAGGAPLHLADAESAQASFVASEGIHDSVGSLLEPETGAISGAWTVALIDTTPCGHGGQCTAVDDGFECACASGFSGDTCQTFDDACALPGYAGCDPVATCAADGPVVSCACPDGYTGDGESCADVDECQDAPCDEHATCANTAGGFDCACDDGWEGDGLTCADVDECADPALFSCDSHADCVNLEPGYECVCSTGWTGDGQTCADVDECADGGVDCGDNASCSNSPGSFECVCDDGFESDGVYCADVDECAAQTDDCDENAKCLNEPGGWSCECLDGYVGDGTTCCGSPGATGETCGEARAICTLPYTHSGLTVGAKNDYGAGLKQCNSGPGGAVGGASPDLVWSFAPATDTAITIRVQADFPHSVYVVHDCAAIAACIPDCTVLGSSCVAAAVAGTGAEAKLETTLKGGLTWFVVVDGEGSMAAMSGSYTLTVE